MIVKTVGRSPENNIVVNDGKVSRTHLQLVCDDQGNVSVVDLGSANGTYVNGTRIFSETRLKPGDELRIGDTALNWQGYFMGEQKLSVTDSAVSPQLKNSPSPHKINKWIFIGVGLLLLIVLSIVFLVNPSQKKEQNVEQQPAESEYNDLEREALAADRDAARAAADYEEAQKIAAQSKSQADQRRADSLKTVYDKSLKEADRLKNDYNKIVAEKNKALKEKEAAEKAANKKVQDAEALKMQAESEKKDAQKKASEAESKANDSKKQAELTTDFYEQLNKARDKGNLKKACETLGIKNKKDKEQYKAIIDKFNKAKDNKAREAILNALRSANGKKTKETIKDDAEEKQPNTDSPIDDAQ